MLIYSLIEITSVIFLRIFYQSLNEIQRLFNDIFAILIPILLSSSTKSTEKISQTKLPKSIFNKNFIFNSIGIIVIEIGGLICFGLIIKKNSLFWEYDVLPRNNVCILSSYIFFYCFFQYLNLFFSVYLICFSEIPPWKLKLFLFEPNNINFEKRLEFNRIFTIIFTFGVIILCFFYKIFVGKFFKRYDEGFNLFELKNNEIISR